MEKILYIMNVDWNWIKQRPHFIAEELMKYYDVDVIYQYRYRRSGYESRLIPPNVKALKLIPHIDKYNKLRFINKVLKKRCIQSFLKQNKYKYIYITSPDQIEWIPSKSDVPIIYDCMDDYIGLNRNANVKERIEIQEKEIYFKANKVFASSEFLKNTLLNRYGFRNINVVRNGYGGLVVEDTQINKITKENKKYTICYFGTIAEWFDFDLILSSLAIYDDIEYLLAGPIVSGVSVPNNKRIHYVGTIPHSELFRKTSHVDCFVMPFIVDDAIRAVDPVKIYEYINFNKNIVCVNYGEVKRFENFAYLYDNKNEYCEIIDKLKKNNKIKYSEADRVNFLKENNWSTRVNQIYKVLEDNK